MESKTIFVFDAKADISGWKTVDDIVMGGKSNGTFTLSPDGFGVFGGNVSLENNGGFSSVRYQFKKILVNASSKIVLKIKGDGKDYQFRIKDDSENYYSYVNTFSTSGEWQIIEIPLKSMSPRFRGRSLDMPNFSEDYIEEIAFLIANKKAEKFKLIMKEIVID